MAKSTGGDGADSLPSASNAPEEHHVSVNICSTRRGGIFPVNGNHRQPNSPARKDKETDLEGPFHTRIMKNRPDVKAIAHAHPPILTGFAIANDGMMEKPFLPEPIIEVGPILMVPYETPLSEALSMQFDAVIDKTNGFLMENHGALFCSPISIEDVVELLNMSECMAESVLVAKLLGNAKTIPNHYVKEMDEVISIRNLKMPGATDKYHSASELYGLD